MSASRHIFNENKNTQSNATAPNSYKIPPNLVSRSFQTNTWTCVNNRIPRSIQMVKSKLTNCLPTMLVPPCRPRTLLIGLIISVALLIISLVLIISILPGLVEKEVIKNVQLIKGTKQYDRFIELPFPVSFKVYFLDVVNPDEILTGSKPIVKEVGPYVYNEFRRKKINSTNDEEDTISYRQVQLFEFNKEASGTLTEEDTVTILNPPMEGMLQSAEAMGQANAIANCIPDIFPKISTRFIKVKVKEILFDGIPFCQHHLSTCGLLRTIACKQAESKRNVKKMEDGSLKFSYFNYKAEDDDGLYTVKRGIDDVQSLGQIIRWNNETHSSFWKAKEEKSSCDEIKGSDGTLLPPQITKDSAFQVYSTDICRYIEIRFSKEETYKGVDGYTFAADNSTLRSSKANKQEDCFCAKRTKNVDGEKSCFLDGAIDMEPCIGSPVLLSLPHFLFADKSYHEGVDGLSPDEERHNTFLTVEPNTGVPIQGAKRIQINTVLRPIANVNSTEKVARAVLPLFWIEESFYLSDAYIDELKDLYLSKKMLLTIAEWTFFAVSLALTLLFAFCLLYKLCLHAPTSEQQVTSGEVVQ